MKTKLPIPCVILAVLSVGGCKNDRSVPTENTRNRNRDWYLKSLTDDLIKIQSAGDRVTFKSKGRYGVWIRTDRSHQTFSNEFSLAVSEIFHAAPDHHARAEFKIVAITNDEVVIGYESAFDHRSFGKRLLSLDRGELRVKYFNKEK